MTCSRAIEAKHFSCPHCGERISLLLDLSAGYQRFIEDCEVCCRPIEVIYQAEGDLIVSFEVRIT